MPGRGFSGNLGGVGSNTNDSNQNIRSGENSLNRMGVGNRSRTPNMLGNNTSGSSNGGSNGNLDRFNNFTGQVILSSSAREEERGVYLEYLLKLGQWKLEISESDGTQVDHVYGLLVRMVIWR